MTISGSYHNVQAAPTKQLNNADPNPTATGAIFCIINGAPFDRAKVVAKGIVGFGEPLTVTVAAEGFVDGCEPLEADDEESRMVNRLEVAYMVPGVEFRKRRK